VYKRQEFVFDAFIDGELVKTVKARSIDSETHARQFWISWSQFIWGLARLHEENLCHDWNKETTDGGLESR